MTIYGKAALIAYKKILEDRHLPKIAWELAMEEKTSSMDTRNKRCPLKTFLALAYGGYLKNIPSEKKWSPSGVLENRAIDAAEYILSNSECDKKKLGNYLGYEDKQGSYDIVITLKTHGILTSPN